uniref:Probable enoyl-CoA hydratase, mitochondrial n=1 Tax=Aplanochytrium stocchinoi TaxID=215587 RepID=A0A7S3LS09_9STRA
MNSALKLGAYQCGMAGTFLRSYGFAGMQSKIGRRHFSAVLGKYEMITVQKMEGRVALVTLNRPKALNALCSPLIDELNDATKALDLDDDVGAIVVTGSEKAFAAGADIKEMAPLDYVSNYTKNFVGQWPDISKIQTPTIAAVNGFALGGGCELAMLCDIIVAGDAAKFGQPEIKLGTIPGCGGTQRLIRAIGKSRAMDLCLTGDMMDVQEAYNRGLVARVFPKEQLVEEALKMARKIASYSKPIVQMAKEAVNVSQETSLQEGLRFERRIFHSTFDLEDRKEGMAAFVEKRAPEFKHK